MENTATPDTNTGTANSAEAQTGAPAITHNEAAPTISAENTVNSQEQNSTQAVESAPAEAVAAEAVVPAEPVVETTVLGQDTKKDAAPEAVEVKTDSEAQPKEEGAQSDEPAPLPAYEPFTLPEGITLNEEAFGEFTKELAEFEALTKGPREEFQKFGQKLVDHHIAEQQKLFNQLQQSYAEAWANQTNQWKTEFESDPEIGGNRRDTTVQAAGEFIRTHGGTAEQQKELRDLFNQTGIGNHKALIRLLANANMGMQEGQPLAATNEPKAPSSKINKRYAGSL